MSESPSVSADGRYVVFDSTAPDIIAGGLPPQAGPSQVYRRDLVTGTTILVSVGTTGAPSHEGAAGPSVSGDGRRVAFHASGADLLPGAGPVTDCYVRDLVAGRTIKVSVSVDGSPVIDSPGRCVISANGRIVVFESSAPNLVPGDTDDQPDLFARDLTTGTTSLIARAGRIGSDYYIDATEVISADGTRVAFTSYAALIPTDTDDQHDVYVRDLRTGTTTLASDDPSNEWVDRAAISGDGQTVAFIDQHYGPGGGGRVRVRDLRTGQTTDVGFALDTAFALSTPELSTDGRFVAYDASPIDEHPDNRPLQSDVYVHDRSRHTTEAVTRTGDATTSSYDPALSGDGRTVAFVSGDPYIADGQGSATRNVLAAHRMGRR